MKKHNAIKVVLVTMLIFLLLTWILPAAYYSGQFVDQGRVQMGLFDLFNYPLTALSYFGYIGLFIILVGGFYGILYKIPAYRTFLEKIVGIFKGKESIAVSIIIAVISILVSVCGVHIGIALFLPFVVAIILLMGYDKIVAALATVGSICVGLIGTTYAVSSSSVLTSTFSVGYKYQIGVRFIILLVGIVLLIFNTIMYSKSAKKATVTASKDKEEKKDEVKVEKVIEKKETTKKEVPTKKSTPAKKTTSTKKTPTKKTTTKKSAKSSSSRKSANKAALVDEDVIVVPNKTTGKHKVAPIAIIFGLLFILFVLAFIPWGDTGLGVKLFDDITKSAQEFKLFGFPIFAKVLGTFNSFGNWSITDMFLPMGLSILLLVIIYRVKLDDVFEGFMEGAKKALVPALISILLYSILVLVTYHPFQTTIYKAVLDLSKGFNIATTTIVAVLAGLFNSDIAYSFQSIAPYYTSVVTNADNYQLAAVIFQSMYGLTMLVAPTSLVLMGILSYLNVSYKEWFKSVWKLLLELFIVLLIVFIILGLM